MGVSDICSVLEEDFDSPHDAVSGRRLDGDDFGEWEAALVVPLEAKDDVVDS